MSPEPKKTALEQVNAILGQAVPMIGTVFAAVALVRELFRRKQAGEPEMALGEMADYMISHGSAVQAFSASWLAEHGYDASGHRIDA